MVKGGASYAVTLAEELLALVCTLHAESYLSLRGNDWQVDYILMDNLKATHILAAQIKFSSLFFFQKPDLKQKGSCFGESSKGEMEGGRDNMIKMNCICL